MNHIAFTKEELRLLVMQVGARLDYLKEEQKREAKLENIQRVMELETFMNQIRSGYKKMTDELYK